MPDTGAPDTGVSPTTRRRRPSRLAVLLLALAVGAAGPLVWWLTRPAPDAGVPLAQVRAGAMETAEPGTAPSDGSATAPRPTPSADAATSSAPGSSADDGVSPFGSVTVRDAGLDSLEVARDPAPTRLRIPDLDVDAAVEAVGVEDDGSMVIPAEVASVGWYRFGPAPGAAAGNAVIAGHVDTAEQGRGALFPLREVAVGTRLTVTDETGVDHEYEVVGRETVVKEALPVDDIFARDGSHVLVIVTCGGPFQPELRSYRDNVVVTAVPVAAGS